MRVDGEDGEQRYRNQERTLRLAELLFNLQGVEGIAGRVDDLRAGKLEPTYAELEAGAFIVRRGISFKYLDEVGRRGSDYDGQLQLSPDVSVNCETKCKVEGTELGESAIRNALDTARKQLPHGEPGLIFLKIPEPWVRNPAVSSCLPTAIDTFLRGTTRVVAVVVRWEEVYVQSARPGAAILYKYRVQRRSSPELPPGIGKLVDRLEGPVAISWTSFYSLAEEVVKQ